MNNSLSFISIALSCSELTFIILDYRRQINDPDAYVYMLLVSVSALVLSLLGGRNTRSGVSVFSVILSIITGVYIWFLFLLEVIKGV